MRTGLQVGLKLLNKLLTLMGYSTIFVQIMGMMNISGLFKAKNHDAGWFAVGVGAQGICLAKVDLTGAMPRVKRCEYHEAGEVSAAALENICRTANVGKHDFTTLLMPGDYQLLLVDAPNVPANELKTAIRWKIKDGLNYHIDDATVDVLQIPASKYGSERAQSMYAIAASNPTIQKRIALFEQAKISLDVIDIPEMAQRNVAALFEQNERALVLLAFDDSAGCSPSPRMASCFWRGASKSAPVSCRMPMTKCGSSIVTVSSWSCSARWIILIGNITIFR